MCWFPYIWGNILLLHNLPLNCHLAAFSPQQNSTNSLVLAALELCILFWYTGLFSHCFFINNCKAKKFFLRKQRTKKTNISHTFFFRGLTFSAEGTKAAASGQHHYKGQPIWLITDCHAMFMHVKALFECKSIQQVFSIIEQLYASSLKFRTCSLIWYLKKTYFPLELHHKNSGEITAPASVYSLHIVFILAASRRNDTDVKYLQDVAASQQGWEELVVMFEVGLLRHWSLQ